MTTTPAPPKEIRCRNASCRQVLAMQVSGWEYRTLANIQGSDRGRVTLICPVCGTRRKFDGDDRFTVSNGGHAA